jgi:hypothetical protein
MTIQKFMLEMDYLKTKVVLHRSFARYDTDSDKHKGSRSEVAEASLRILELYDWFYRSPATQSLRDQFWMIISTITYNYYNHALYFVFLSVINHYDQIQPELRTRFLKAVYDSEQTLETCNKLIMMDKLHMRLFRLVIAEVKRVASMSLEERYRRRQEHLSNKRLPLTAGKSNNRRGLILDLDARDATVDVNYLSGTYSSPESYNSAMAESTTEPEQPTPVNWPFFDDPKLQQAALLDEWNDLNSIFDPTSDALFRP